MKLHRAAWIGLVLVFARVGIAQTQQDALDILNKVGQTYRGVKTLQAEGDLTTSMSGPDLQQNMTAHMLMTLGGSGKVRIESKTGMMNFLMVSDGQTTWLYMPALNKYAKFPTPPAATTGGPPIPGGMHGMDSLEKFGNIADNVKGAKLVRSETLQLDGIATDCYVIEFVSSGPSGSGTPLAATTMPKVEEDHETVWVDKSRLLVARVSSRAKITLPGESTPTETQSDLTFNKLSLDAPTPDDAFVFAPPAGASELDLSQFMPQGANPH